MIRNFSRMSIVAVTLTALVLPIWTAAAQSTTQGTPTATTGTNPDPQGVTGTNPEPQGVTGTNPDPQVILTILLSILPFA